VALKERLALGEELTAVCSRMPGRCRIPRRPPLGALYGAWDEPVEIADIELSIRAGRS
jgi:hypothetical protein